MANKRSDGMCVSMRICVENEINEAIEKFKAERFIKGEPLKKYEAAERYFEMLYRLHNKEVK